MIEAQYHCAHSYFWHFRDSRKTENVTSKIQRDIYIYFLLLVWHHKLFILFVFFLQILKCHSMLEIVLCIVMVLCLFSKNKTKVQLNYTLMSFKNSNHIQSRASLLWPTRGYIRTHLGVPTPKNPWSRTQDLLLPAFFYILASPQTYLTNTQTEWFHLFFCNAFSCTWIFSCVKINQTKGKRSKFTNIQTDYRCEKALMQVATADKKHILLNVIFKHTSFVVN